MAQDRAWRLNTRCTIARGKHESLTAVCCLNFETVYPYYTIKVILEITHNIYIYIFQMIESIINYTILNILQRPTPPRLAMAGARRWNPRRFGARVGKVPGCGGREILRRFHPDPVRISDHHCGMVNARWIQPSFHCEIVKIPAMWRISSRSILLLFQESATGW